MEIAKRVEIYRLNDTDEKDYNGRRITLEVETTTGEVLIVRVTRPIAAILGGDLMSILRNTSVDGIE